MNILKYSMIILFPFLLNTAQAQKATIDFLPDQPYDRYRLDASGDTITFYLSVSSRKESLPLIVYVQGSGMNSLFEKRNGRIVSAYGHMSWFDAGKEQYRVLVVEKPGIQYLQTGESAQFDKKFSLDSWSRTIETAIKYVLGHEKIDHNKVLLAGHSEGGVAAARVAQQMKDTISHVAIMAGEGPSQLYSLYRFAADGTFFNTKEHNMPAPEARISYLTEKWRDIQADPGNTEKKFWGFTYLRWSSLLHTSVIDELSAYNGKILLLQGTADKAVYPESAVVAYTSLLSRGKQVQLEQVEGADHSFNIAEQAKLDGWKMVIEKVMHWFTP